MISWTRDRCWNRACLASMTFFTIWPANYGAPRPGGIIQSACPLDRAESPAITDTSVGTLTLSMSLDSLTRLCPRLRDTTVAGPGGGGTIQRFPGRIYGSDRLQVVALQYQDTVLRPTSPADGWIVRGQDGTLPGGVPLTASWRELAEVYGRANASAGTVVVVRFCSLPTILFTINADPHSVVASNGQVDLSRIPASATVHHIFILGQRLRDALRPCA